MEIGQWQRVRDFHLMCLSLWPKTPRCLTRNAANYWKGGSYVKCLAIQIKHTHTLAPESRLLNSDPLPGVTIWQGKKQTNQLNTSSYLQQVFSTHNPATEAAFSGYNRYRLGPSSTSFETIIQVFKQE